MIEDFDAQFAEILQNIETCLLKIKKRNEENQYTTPLNGSDLQKFKEARNSFEGMAKTPIRIELKHG